MNFVEAVKSGLTQPFVWSGRASRSEYWWFVLFYSIVGVLGYVLFNIPVSDLSADAVLALDIGAEVAIVLAAYIYLFVCGIAVLIKRLHDTNHCGWWYFLSFIPIVGPFYLLYLTIKQGDESSNKYGDNPLGRE